MNITGTLGPASTPPIRDGFVRETFRLPRPEARAKARAWLDRWPRAAYWSEVEAWSAHRQNSGGGGGEAATEDDIIEFTMRRLPTAD